MCLSILCFSLINILGIDFEIIQMSITLYLAEKGWAALLSVDCSIQVVAGCSPFLYKPQQQAPDQRKRVTGRHLAANLYVSGKQARKRAAVPTCLCILKLSSAAQNAERNSRSSASNKSFAQQTFWKSLDMGQPAAICYILRSSLQRIFSLPLKSCTS